MNHDWLGLISLFCLVGLCGPWAISTTRAR
jgi:hypothetical protein